MKTMCPPGYHHNGFVATHALGHMMWQLMHLGNFSTLNLSLLLRSTLCVVDHL